MVRILSTLCLVIGLMSSQLNKAAQNKGYVAPTRDGSSITVDSHDCYFSPQQAPAKPATNPPHWYDSLKRPEWWGIVAAVITLGILWVQTGVAKKSAEAALLNAQAVINAERALLLFKVKMDRSGQFMRVNIFNYGKTTARKLKFSNPIHAATTLDELVSHSPEYGDTVIDIQEWLAPREKWRVTDIFVNTARSSRFLESQRLGVDLASITYFVYGQVTYFDGISTERRHSRYCFAFGDDPDEPLAVGGDDRYVDCT